MASLEDFNALDIRVGKVLRVEDPPEDVKKPVLKLTIDFGPEVGEKVSFAGIRDRYDEVKLLGKLVLGVTNLPPRKIGSATSEVLTLGVADEHGKVLLVVPEGNPPLGERLH